MIYMRRIPGIIYRKRYIVLSVVAIVVSSIILLLHWGILCTNIQAWQHVSYLHEICVETNCFLMTSFAFVCIYFQWKCELHRKGRAIGSLCAALCVDGQFHTLTCHPFHAGKDAVFSAIWMIQDTPRTVFKAARLGIDGEKDYLAENTVYTIDEDGKRKYPSETEFEAMLAKLVSSKLNISVPQDKLRKLGHLGPSAMEGLPGSSSDKRKREMEAVWFLLQGHEYLVSVLFEEREVFPRVVGTCGPYFASEWADPLEWEESKEEWINRVHAAVLVLELLEALEDPVPAFRLCDIRPGDFGITNDGSKAKVLDSDLALPQAVADKMTGEGKPCSKDEDCHYFDCKSRCHKGFCSEPVLNSNMQVVCDKVFLNQKLPGGAMVLPGLLMSEHTPSSLTALLRLCVDHPTGESADYVRKKLYGTLSQMEMALIDESI